MSVIIHGIHKPAECEWCQFRLWSLKEELFCGITNQKVECGCPMEELPPHGRLVDSDAVQSHWFQLNFDGKISDGTLAYWNMLLSDVPTVIEAEREE